MTPGVASADRRQPTPALVRAAVQLAPVLILTIFALAMAMIISVAGSTLGYDYDAYVVAARHALDGRPLYDPSLIYAVGHTVFLYPPAFALAMIPFALLPDTVALWAWLGFSIAALLAGIWLLPVRPSVRWTIVLLAAMSWATLYTIKLGQVGPVLLLAFAIGWRWLDRPVVVGAVMTAGALIKVQPALLFGWAFATGRWRAFAVGIGVVVVAVVVTAAVVGPGAFGDYLGVLVAISKPVTTPKNFTVGAIAFQLGTPESVATAIQWTAMAASLGIAVFAWLRTDAATSYVVTVVASQLISPVLWDHYAILLLIPTALLLERRQWWAVAIPLASWLPPPAFPVVFFLALVAPILTAPRRGATKPLPATLQPA